jgi:hypothetical protein
MSTLLFPRIESLDITFPRFTPVYVGMLSNPSCPYPLPKKEDKTSPANKIKKRNNALLLIVIV